MTNPSGLTIERRKLFEQGFRECRICKVVKPLVEYSTLGPNRPNSLSSYRAACKRCYNEANQLARSKHPVATKRKSKFKSILRNHGLTMEQWTALFEEQKGCCGICLKHTSEFKLGLYVDHNHTTKRVRSLLCSRCNSGLGMFEENRDLLAAASAYLLKHGDSNGQ